MVARAAQLQMERKYIGPKQKGRQVDYSSLLMSKGIITITKRKCISLATYVLRFVYKTYHERLTPNFPNSANHLQSIILLDQALSPN